MSKTIPDKDNDVPTMRHKSNPNLTDPTFFIANEVDITLSLDAKEDVLLDGLCIRESIVSLVESGSVYSSGNNTVASHNFRVPIWKPSFELLGNRK